MLEDKGRDGSQDESADRLTPIPAEQTAETHETEVGPSKAENEPVFDESLVEELAALYDDGKTYAEAEIAFQKARAGLAGRSIGLAAGYVVVAIVLLHIAFLALAVGMVMALEPLVTIWGAIAIVVGALLLGVALLGYAAYGHGKLLGELYGNAEKPEDKA